MNHIYIKVNKWLGRKKINSVPITAPSWLCSSRKLWVSMDKQNFKMYFNNRSVEPNSRNLLKSILRRWPIYLLVFMFPIAFYQRGKGNILMLLQLKPIRSRFEPGTRPIRQWLLGSSEWQYYGSFFTHTKDQRDFRPTFCCLSSLLPDFSILRSWVFMGHPFYCCTKRESRWLEKKIVASFEIGL